MPEIVKCSYCGNDVNAEDIAECTPIYRDIEINICKNCDNLWLNSSGKDRLYWLDKDLRIKVNAIILAIREIEKDIKALDKNE